MSSSQTQPLSSGLPLQDPPNPQSTITTTLPLLTTDVVTTALSGMEVTIPMTTSNSLLSSPGRNVDANVSLGRDVDANVSPGRDVDANVLPGRNVDANVSLGLNVTVDSIRSSFLQFMAANHLLDSATIAA
ncbi:hypothetical protein FB446DRAFT_795806, partial [Lentinula raphanica]